MDENFETKCAFLWLLVMLPLLVPVKVSLGLEHLAAVTEELLLWLDLPVWLVDFLVL